MHVSWLVIVSWWIGVGVIDKNKVAHPQFCQLNCRCLVDLVLEMAAAMFLEMVLQDRYSDFV